MYLRRSASYFLIFFAAFMKQNDAPRPLVLAHFVSVMIGFIKAAKGKRYKGYRAVARGVLCGNVAPVGFTRRHKGAKGQLMDHGRSPILPCWSAARLAFLKKGYRPCDPIFAPLCETNWRSVFARTTLEILNCDYLPINSALSAAPLAALRVLLL